MTVPLDDVNVIREMDAEGGPEGGDRAQVAPEPQRRGQIRRHGRHVTSRAGAKAEKALRPLA